MSLYNDNCASMLLGALCNNLSLLYNPQYPISKTDFTPQPLHRIIFCCLQKLAESGANQATEIEIDNVLQAHPTQYETAQDNNFCELVSTIRELANVDNYAVYYNEVRKFSLLRDLKENGYDVSKWYDELDEAESGKNLSKVTSTDILNTLEAEQSKIRSKYDVKYTRDEIDAGENIDELLGSLKETPAFGALLQSGYLSTLFNGWSRGHLLCRAGPSSSGKTRCSVADLCSVGVKYFWDDEAKEFVENTNYQSPTLYIATEQDIRREVQPMFLSAVSGIEYRDIVNGNTTAEQDEILKEAGNILVDSQIHIVSMPNFTQASLERKIKEQVETKGIQYCVFDYMEVQGSLSAEFKSMNAVTPRQDLILLDLASKLKIIAEDYNVGILTGQQLNDSWKTTSYIDDGCLAGGKATKFKLDSGSIIIPTTYLKRDMKKLAPYFDKQRLGFGDKRMPLPNICEYIFKGRHSVYGDQLLKLWSYFDRGTFKRYDYFITNAENEVVHIKPTKVVEDF